MALDAAAAAADDDDDDIEDDDNDEGGDGRDDDAVEEGASLEMMWTWSISGTLFKWGGFAHHSTSTSSPPSSFSPHARWW